MIFKPVLWIWNQNRRVIHLYIPRHSKLFIEKIMRVTGPSKVCNKMTICQRLEVVQELTETMFKNYQGCSLSNMEGAQSWREAWPLSKKKVQQTHHWRSHGIHRKLPHPTIQQASRICTMATIFPSSVLRNRHLCEYVWEQLINFSAQITIVLTVLNLT